MADAPEHAPRNRTPPLPDEAAVIARAADGDRGAFTRLMEHYQSACYGLAWRLLRDPDRAADATQDAFVHAYTAIRSYRGGLFRSWLLRITANASYDILRRQQRRPAGPLPDPEEGAPELPDVAAVAPDAEAARSELYRHLERALMTESALGTVKSRIHRGRLRLRELMADHRELFTS
jgi:RNA polymerase sigma factor (sigma-70 family)